VYTQVNPESKASEAGIRDGDIVSTINGHSTVQLTNADANKLINCGDQLSLELTRNRKHHHSADTIGKFFFHCLTN